MCEDCPQGTACAHYCNPEAPVCQNKAIYDRLADYEDTGMEPEEMLSVEELAKVAWTAEKDGRLVVLPCKVGDPVWVVERRAESPPEILKEKVMCFSEISRGTVMMISYRDYCSRPLVRDIGKLKGEGHLSVFLTQMEAEAALGNESRNDDGT